MSEEGGENDKFTAKLYEYIKVALSKPRLVAVVATLSVFLSFATLITQVSQDSRIALGVILGAVIGAIGALLDRSKYVMILRIELLKRRLPSGVLKKNNAAISLTYLAYLRKLNSFPKLALSVTAGLSAVCHIWYPDLQILPIALVCIVFLVLIMVREAVIEFRVRMGYFGTQRSEAREIIKFMLVNADNMDFTDDGGGPRKTLLSDYSSQSQLTIEGNVEGARS